MSKLPTVVEPVKNKFVPKSRVMVATVVEESTKFDERSVEVASSEERFSVVVEVRVLIAENTAVCPGVPVAFTMNPVLAPPKSEVIAKVPSLSGKV